MLIVYCLMHLGDPYVIVAHVETMLRVAYRALDSRHYFPSSMYPTDRLKAEHKHIYQEYLAYREKCYVPLYREVDKVQGMLDTGDKAWRTLHLRIFGQDTSIAKAFPYTMSLLSTLPCTTAMFSVLEAGKVLQPHTGIYSGVLRYHLCLKTTQGCRLVVNGEERVWKEGEALVFDDTYTHSAENLGDKDRVVLFLDLIRPCKDRLLDLFNLLFLVHTQKCQTVLDDVARVESLTKL